jgi:hypothetical protein
MPELTHDQIEAIRDGRLAMDALVCNKIGSALTFCFIGVPDYATALAIENAIKGGGLRAECLV